MTSKRIDYRVKGHDDETYIFLDKHSDNTYSVRSGTSRPIGHLKWDGKETVQTVEEFLAGNPSYTEKVNQLMAEFESDI